MTPGRASLFMHVVSAKRGGRGRCPATGSWKAALGLFWWGSIGIVLMRPHWNCSDEDTCRRWGSHSCPPQEVWEIWTQESKKQDKILSLSPCWGHEAGRGWDWSSQNTFPWRVTPWEGPVTPPHCQVHPPPEVTQLLQTLLTFRQGFLEFLAATSTMHILKLPASLSFCSPFLWPKQHLSPTNWVYFTVCKWSDFGWTPQFSSLHLLSSLIVKTRLCKGLFQREKIFIWSWHSNWWKLLDSLLFVPAEAMTQYLYF